MQNNTKNNTKNFKYAVKVLLKNLVVDFKYMAKNIAVALAWLMSFYAIIEWCFLNDNTIRSMMEEKYFNILISPWPYFCLAFLYVIIKQLSYSKFNNHFTNVTKSMSMTVRLGDIFEGNSAVVVPVNNTFETRLDKIIEGSIHGQVVSGKATRTDSNEELIIKQLREQGIEEGNEYDYDTVAKIKLPVGKKRKKKRCFYFLVSSVLKDSHGATTTLANIYKSIDGLFNYMQENTVGDSRKLSIPVIGAGAADSHQETDTFKYIMKAYSDHVYGDINSATKSTLGFNELIVCIRPRLHADGIIDLKELREYSKLVTAHPDPSLKVRS